MFEAYKPTSRFRAAVIGLLLFLPGFIFSLPFTMWWAVHYYAGEAQTPLGGFPVSLAIGIICAGVGCFVLIRRVGRHPQQNS